MAHLAWLWIPITIGAAFPQLLRNAAQRSLTSGLGTLGARLIRALYGLPFGLIRSCSMPQARAQVLQG